MLRVGDRLGVPRLQPVRSQDAEGRADVASRRDAHVRETELEEGPWLDRAARGEVHRGVARGQAAVDLRAPEHEPAEAGGARADDLRRLLDVAQVPEHDARV